MVVPPETADRSPNVDDLTFGTDGVDVLIRRSKTDQKGAGRGRQLYPRHPSYARGGAPGPAGRGIKSGPIFRAVTRSGLVVASATIGHTVANVVSGMPSWPG
ncbi:hypothetical protein [Devosia sp. UYZn731]|uniref:hypothetical protein n=1 Tax=Devosia sp. UYZn731 TaxID=3156345 RepID=UPI003390AE5D